MCTHNPERSPFTSSVMAKPHQEKVTGVEGHQREPVISHSQTSSHPDNTATICVQQSSSRQSHRPGQCTAPAERLDADVLALSACLRSVTLYQDCCQTKLPPSLLSPLALSLFLRENLVKQNICSLLRHSHCVFKFFLKLF